MPTLSDTIMQSSEFSIRLSRCSFASFNSLSACFLCVISLILATDPVMFPLLSFKRAALISTKTKLPSFLTQAISDPVALPSLNTFSKNVVPASSYSFPSALISLACFPINSSFAYPVIFSTEPLTMIINPSGSVTIIPSAAVLKILSKKSLISVIFLSDFNLPVISLIIPTAPSTFPF